MKGTIPCNRRISYMDGKRTIVPKMFWKHHVENVFLEVLEWIVGSVKSEKAEASRHRENPEDLAVGSLLSSAAEWSLSNVWIFWRKRNSHESIWTVTGQPAQPSTNRSPWSILVLASDSPVTYEAFPYKANFPVLTSASFPLLFFREIQAGGRTSFP